MRSIWFRERGQDLWTISKRSRGELQLSSSRPEGCADRKAAKIRVCTAQDIHSLHNEGPALQESRSTHQIQAQGERLHQCEVMSFRRCGCFPRMRNIWLRERGQDLRTMYNIKSPDVSSSRRPASRRRGSWQPPARAQGHWDPAKVPLSVIQNWQQVETAASWKSCSLPGLRRPFRGVRESWSFRLYGGLPRDVAELGDLRPVLSCIAHLCRKDPRRPSNWTFVAVPHSKINTSRHAPSALKQFLCLKQ